MSDSTPTSTRRAFLAAAGLAATSGCVRQIQSAVARDSPDQLSLSVKTVPADADVAATRIARFLAGNLSAVGIDATVVPMSREELYRDVLVNQSFDLYVGRFPAHYDPDFLRLLLHSRFGVEPGWQNPFGYADLSLDDLLDAQARQTGSERAATLAKIQRRIARDQPFSVVAFPDEVRAERRSDFIGWADGWTGSVTDYLALRPTTKDVTPTSTPTSTRTEVAGQTAPETRTTTPSTETPSDPDAPTGRSTTATTATATTAGPDEERTVARMTITDSRPTENRNPLAVEFRSETPLTGLVYDPLARRVDGAVVPWAAESWEWTDEGTPSAEVTLRPDQTWHDGESLTADDVAFTYRFLADTSLGSFSTPLPAPRFRSRSSLVDEVTPLDDDVVRIDFGEASPEVAATSLTVPVLPEHVWEERATRATLAGIDTGSPVTDALVWNNPNPVGSGPFRFVDATVDEFVSFEPFDDHFLEREGVADVAGTDAGGVPVDRLRFDVVPSSSAAVELLARDRADGTASPLDPSTVPDIGRVDALDFHVSRSRGFYHLGFNTRADPLGDPRFRRAVAGLLDKQFLVDEVFDGYAHPATSPLDGSGPVPPELEWDGRDPELPFPGSRGTLNAEQARRRFEEAGYRYTDGGRLVYG